jgi:hypothetical protein
MFGTLTSATSSIEVKKPKSPYPRLPRCLLDSGASITMHPTHIPFHRYEPSHTPVMLADQLTIPATGEGPSTIPTVGRPLHIPRALHVPHLQDHLVSASQVSFHHDIMFQGPKVYILQRGPTPEKSRVLTQVRRIRVYTSSRPYPTRSSSSQTLHTRSEFQATLPTYTTHLIAHLHGISAISSDTTPAAVP